MRLSIIRIIFFKEITEALRDRVTLFVLVGLPLLIYPLAMVAIGGVAKHLEAVQDRQVNTVAVWGAGAAPLFDRLNATNSYLTLERWRGIPAALRAELEAGRLPLPARTNLPPTRVERHPGLATLGAP